MNKERKTLLNLHHIQEEENNFTGWILNVPKLPQHPSKTNGWLVEHQTLHIKSHQSSQQPIMYF